MEFLFSKTSRRSYLLIATLILSQTDRADRIYPVYASILKDYMQTLQISNYYTKKIYINRMNIKKDISQSIGRINKFNYKLCNEKIVKFCFILRW